MRSVLSTGKVKCTLIPSIHHKKIKNWYGIFLLVMIEYYITKVTSDVTYT